MVPPCFVHLLNLVIQPAFAFSFRILNQTCGLAPSSAAISDTGSGATADVHPPRMLQAREKQRHPRYRCASTILLSYWWNLVTPSREHRLNGRVRDKTKTLTKTQKSPVINNAQLRTRKEELANASNLSVLSYFASVSAYAAGRWVSLPCSIRGRRQRATKNKILRYRVRVRMSPPLFESLGHRTYHIICLHSSGEL